MSNMNHQLEPLRDTSSIIRNTLPKLIKHASLYLSGRDLAALNIVRSDLDLQSGKASDNGLQFLYPLPRAKIHRVIEDTQPYLHYKLPEEPDSSAICAALEISCLLKVYLDWSKDEENGIKPLLHRTKWQIRSMDLSKSKYLISAAPGQNYYGSFMLGIRDHSVPHKSCFIAGETPLIPNSLLKSEIFYILAMLTRRNRRKPNQVDGVIPVTVFSASSWQVRVLQAFIDNKTGHIRVRESPIVDFSKGGEELTELLLSWLLADPVGVGPYEPTTIDGV